MELIKIIACFQSALADDVLRWSAIRAWGTLVENVQSGEVGTMLAQMFAVFVQIWPLCSAREKDLIRMVIQDAVTRHEQIVMTDYSIPSLSGIPELEKLAKRLDEWRTKAAPRLALEVLIRRCSHETAAICHRALVELRDYLVKQELYLHTLILGENCDKLVDQLLRSLLDITARYHDTDSDIIALAVECLGIVGAVDPSRTDAAKEVVDMTLQHNFEDAEESVLFAMTLVEQRLVGYFRAATDTKAQSYLAWAMQELLVFCGLTSQLLDTTKGLGTDQLMLRKWGHFSKASRETLTPLLTSRYSITSRPPAEDITYPIFTNQPSYRDWLQKFTLATMNEAQEENARKIFTTICSRIIKDQDLGIANFVLPYALLNVIISGTDQHRENIRQEFLAVLESGSNATTEQEAAKSRLANQSVFLFVDYLQKWLRQHRKAIMERKHLLAKKANRYVAPDEDEEVDPAITRVEGVLSALPPDLMASASFQCGSYARALFHWEQYIRDNEQEPPEDGMDPLYARWQEIYNHLDEPDGIEGISTKFTFQTFDQQILEHETAGHWSAAQSCYELILQQEPSNLVIQKGFLNCMKQSGHHETYLSQVSGLVASFPENVEVYSTLAIESAWMAGSFTLLEQHVRNSSQSGFEYQVGEALLALRDGNTAQFHVSISNAQTTLAHAIVATGTDSSRQCYDALARLHALQELKAIRANMSIEGAERRGFMTLLDERLKFMVPMAKYQQFTLALRRAAMELTKTTYPVIKSSNSRIAGDRDIAASWLSSSKIARKAGQFDEAYNAILHASALDLQMSRLEHARWWWHQGQSRKAIESLQNSFAANVFDFNRDATSGTSSNLSLDEVATNSHNVMLGKAMALLAKWLDSAKQTSEEDLLNRYKKVQSICERWEKSHYLLGHYYNRLLEHEETKPLNRQKDSYLTGDLTRLVSTSYLRSLQFGNKYLYETLPRVLTLWLDFGANIAVVVSTREDRPRVAGRRQASLTSMNEHVERALKKLPVYLVPLKWCC
jgi:serine/threonine-protein kinase ATR